MAIVPGRKMVHEQKIAEFQGQHAEEPTDQSNNMLSATQSEVAKNLMLAEEVQKLKRQVQQK